MEKTVKYLVVDSGAFIKNSPVHEYAENIYTVKDAVNEIKDKATRQRLQFLPYTLQIKEPSPDAYKYVLEFSKKTGDFSSLSATDLQIIALTYQLEKEHVGTDHLNKEPSCKVTGKPCFTNNQLSGFYYPKEDIDEEIESPNIKNSENNSQNETKIRSLSLISEDDTASESCSSSDAENDSKEKQLDVVDNEEVNESDSEEDSWITPNNIKEIQKKMGSLALEQESSVSVACVTTDFSIQNVLLQIGLHVVSVDGMLIKQARVFILRCYACYKTTSNVTKQFCPNCGNKTLKRVAVTVNEDGSKSIHINFRKPINIRGTRYSLPMPKGGRHAGNPVLCEDQPVPQNRPTKSAMQKTNILSKDYEYQAMTLASPFALNDVYSRAASLGIMKSNKNKTHKKNPNEWSKRSGNKKRK